MPERGTFRIRLLDAKTKLQQQLEDVWAKEEVCRNYKRCLCYNGELLVESVARVLHQGLGFKLDEKEDEGIEDKAIVDSDGKEVVLVEIKGSNQNVESKDVYQADSHRGRRGKPDDFPSVLIVNTFIKSANSRVILECCGWVSW